MADVKVFPDKLLTPNTMVEGIEEFHTTYHAFVISEYIVKCVSSEQDSNGTIRKSKKGQYGTYAP
jgi:hypothetical protein